MGNYAIVIMGTGCHHNADNHTDADRMAHQFVNKLVEAGHTIDGTAFQVMTEGRKPEALLEGKPIVDGFYRPSNETPTESAVEVPQQNSAPALSASDEAEKS